jgi:hypothetical protein
VFDESSKPPSSSSPTAVTQESWPVDDVARGLLDFLLAVSESPSSSLSHALVLAENSDEEFSIDLEANCIGNDCRLADMVVVEEETTDCISIRAGRGSNNGEAKGRVLR